MKNQLQSPDAPFAKVISPFKGKSGTRKVKKRDSQADGYSRNLCRSPSESSSRNSAQLLVGCDMTSSHQMYSPFISSKINPENLEVPSAKEVFITKAQDGFTLKSRRNPDKEHDDFQ